MTTFGDAKQAMRVIMVEAARHREIPADDFPMNPTAAQLAEWIGVEKLPPHVEDARRVWNRFWRDAIDGVLAGKTTDEVLT